MTHGILGVYVWLLRLYPPEFRAEFADEMQAVFALALQEAGEAGALALVEICLAELRDLPVSLIREHLWERRQRRWTMGDEMLATRTPIIIYRFCTLFLFVIPITYVLFVGVPFFVLGLHEQPVDLVASGAFDPGGLPFYLTPIGQMIHLVGFCSVFPGFVCLPSLNIPLIWVLLRRWTHWSRWQRRLGLLAVLVSFFTLGLMFLPPGRVIVAWFLD